MEVSECCDPHTSIDTVGFNNPARDSEMKTPPHSQDHFLFDTLQQILGREKKKSGDEIATEEPLWARGEGSAVHADLVSISST